VHWRAAACAAFASSPDSFGVPADADQAALATDVPRPAEAVPFEIFTAVIFSREKSASPILPVTRDIAGSGGWRHGFGD
jgi:hypothetical protein